MPTNAQKGRHGQRTTNYRRGYEIERALVNADRKKGFVSLRSAGSHSPIDVISIDTEGREIVLRQVKRVKSGNPQEDNKICQIPCGLYNVRTQLYIWRDRQGAEVIDLDLPDAAIGGA